MFLREGTKCTFQIVKFYFAILCSNARAKVAEMVRASTIKHSEDPVLNPSCVSYLFFLLQRKAICCIATKAHEASQQNSEKLYLIAFLGQT